MTGCCLFGVSKAECVQCVLEELGGVCCTPVTLCNGEVFGTEDYDTYIDYLYEIM